jgi:acyl-CoA synthetase (AMP-forming)/AMP-acid ligase II
LFAARETGARMLIVPAMWRGFDYAALASDVATEVPGLDVIVVGSRLPDADPDMLPDLPEPSDGHAGPVRWIYYTSGTTGDPKGVQHSDATIIAGGRSLASGLRVVAEDREALVFPFAHIGGAVWLAAGLMRR